MKIIDLRFMNLNSLMGEWYVDFTDKEYLSNGIFAITGPTGSGKSTLLDGLCLALYGQTPRLGKITKSSNAVMSRLSAECYSEVTFKSSLGLFRCRWSQHRAHKKSDGNLIEAEHEICDAETGKILESKKRDVLSVVEEKTGMDFERFTRSILLAQGDFNAFLEAGANERAPILEQITGTGIYSDLSMEVHRIRKEKETALSLLEAESLGIKLLSEEEEKNLHKSLGELKEKGEPLQKEQERINSALTLWDRYEELCREKETIAVSYGEILSEREVFRRDENRLRSSEKASELKVSHEQLRVLRQQFSRDEQQILELERSIPLLQNQLKEMQERAQKCDLDVQQLDSDLNRERDLWQKVRKLDQSINDRDFQIQQETENCNLAENLLRESEQERSSIESSINAGRENLLQYRKELESLDFDRETLNRNISGLESLSVNLRRIDERMVTLREQLNQVAHRITQAEKTNKSSAEDIILLKKREKECSNQLQSLLDEYSGILDGEDLEKIKEDFGALNHSRIYLSRVESLEEERAHLKQGEPCPLCGSPDHPYITEELPAVNTLDTNIEKLKQRIEKAETLERELLGKRHEESSLSESLKHREKELQRAEEHCSELLESRTVLESELQGLQEEHEECRRQFLELLEPWGEDLDSLSNHESLLDKLRNRAETWKSRETHIQSEQERLRELEQRRDTIAALEGERSETLRKRSRDLEQLRSDYKELEGERETLFGRGDPDIEERNMLEKQKSLSDLLQRIRSEKQAAEIRLNGLFEQQEEISLRLKDMVPERDSLEKDFTDKLSGAGFNSEQEWREALISDLERDALRNRKEDLEKRFISLESRLKDVEERAALGKEQVSRLSTRQELVSGKQIADQALQANLGEQGALAQRIQDQEEARARLGSRRREIQILKEDIDLWNQLYELIGSADGKKFRNFAQGLTFDLVLSHANRQLARMTDRYLLIRDRELPLELNVIDNWQAGEIRTTRNLSGGESFIVSLALALGLSAMAGSRVRVDSLFLDEGFGTLDEESLDTALEALSGLHQDGKLIGIISHVPALKERIGVQIQVRRRDGGRSSLSGPGVKSL